MATKGFFLTQRSCCQEVSLSSTGEVVRMSFFSDVAGNVFESRPTKASQLLQPEGLGSFFPPKKHRNSATYGAINVYYFWRCFFRLCVETRFRNASGLSS